MDYQEYRRLPLPERRRIFQELTAEEKAALVRGQNRAWLAENRERLTPEQIAFLDEAHAFITPERYMPGGDPRDADPLVERMKQLFDFDDMMQCSHMQGDDVPRFTDASRTVACTEPSTVMITGARGAPAVLVNGKPVNLEGWPPRASVEVPAGPTTVEPEKGARIWVATRGQATGDG